MDIEGRSAQRRGLVSRQKVSGILVVAGLILAIAASIVFPAEYYMAESETERQSILDANQTGWVVTNWLWVAAGVVTSVGLLLFALQYRDPISMVGAGFFVIGSAFWVRYAYLRIFDASVTIDGLWMEVVFAWMTTIGLGLMGIAFVRGEFPNWVGYVNVGYAILFVLTFILFRARMYEFFAPQIIYLVASFTGIVSIRRG
jgi:hypothetical protein